MRSQVVIIAFSLAGAAGCTQNTMTFLVSPEPPIVWPRPPDVARVRYVGSLTGSADIGQQKSFGEIWDELLYGPQRQPKLVSPQAVAVDSSGTRVAVADVNGKCVHLFDLAARRYTPLVHVAPDPHPTTEDRATSGLFGATGSLSASVERGATGGLPSRVLLASAPDPSELDRAPERNVRQIASSTLECPVAVAWTEDRLWVADSMHSALAVFEPTNSRGTGGQAASGTIGRWIGRGTLERPAGMVYCPDNQICYVSDAATHRISAFDQNGELVYQFGSRGAKPGQFNCPSHLAVEPDGTLVVADSLNFRVQRLQPDGSPICAFGRKGDAAGDLALPKGVAVDDQGVIWVVDAQFENVQAFTGEGQLLMAFGKEGHEPGEFWLPAGICIDAQRRMWIADRENARVQVFSLLP